MGSPRQARLRHQRAHRSSQRHQGQIYEASVEEGVQGRVSLHQDGGQEGGVGFQRHGAQSHREERVQTRGGEGKSGFPQRVETRRRGIENNPINDPISLSLVLSCQTVFHFFLLFLVVRIMYFDFPPLSHILTLSLSLSLSLSSVSFFCDDKSVDPVVLETAPA